MQSDRGKDSAKDFGPRLVIKRAAELSRFIFGHYRSAALSKNSPVTLGYQLIQRNDARHLVRQTKLLRKFLAVNNKGCVLDSLITTNQKAVIPFCLHF